MVWVVLDQIARLIGWIVLAVSASVMFMWLSLVFVSEVKAWFSVPSSSSLVDRQRQQGREPWETHR